MIKQKLRLAFYGDDFTGSTDAMEALAQSGYRTVLFLETPSKEIINEFKDIECFGVAGTARAKDPEEMEKELDPILKSFSKIESPIVHYKVCSTFDSSKGTGSIGTAIKVARKYFKKQKAVPLLVGAPTLKRYTLFGNHFAGMGDEVFRLDRHPVMSKHPITPMNEADLRLHLGEQLQEKVGLIDVLELNRSGDELINLYRDKAEKEKTILFDSLNQEHLKKVGKVIWEVERNSSHFVVGSSGVEYALTAHWNTEENKPLASVKNNIQLSPAKSILVVSGSASSITKMQIEKAIDSGFYAIKVPTNLLIDEKSFPYSFLQAVITRLIEGQSVIVYTALGPEDEAIKEIRNSYSSSNFNSGEVIGNLLGKWTKYIIDEAKIRRIVIAGGDTSGFVTKQLNLYALEMLKSISPGAPLCKGYTNDRQANDLEIALKGGQFGSLDYFEQVKDAKKDTSEEVIKNV